MNDLDFWREYERLSERGNCDMPGEMEYDRVLAAWQKAGRPVYIEEFIRAGANHRPPTEK